MPGSVRCDQDGRLSESVHAAGTPVYKRKFHTPGGGGGLLGPLPLCLQRVGLEVFLSQKANAEDPGRYNTFLDSRTFLAGA